MLPPQHLLLKICVTSLILAPWTGWGQDAAPVDTVSLLKELKTLRDKQTVQGKQTRQTAMQAASTASANSEKAVQFWGEAVSAIQFNGVPAKENPAFKDWLEKDGEALNHSACRNALRLYFTWMGLTLQRAGGTPVKDLLPQVVSYVKDLIADDLAMDSVEEGVKKEKDAGQKKQQGAPVQAQHPKKISDDTVKRVHDSILKRGFGPSPVVQFWKIGQYLNTEEWENNPGNVDGIYQQILLPILRENQDVRALDYWEFKLRREADLAAKNKFLAEQDKYTTIRRPNLLWSRAEEMLFIGQRNRAISEMMNIIRGNPAHPELQVWISYVSNLLGGATAPASAAPAEPSPPILQ